MAVEGDVCRRVRWWTGFAGQKELLLPSGHLLIQRGITQPREVDGQVVEEDAGALVIRT